ncbi:MAG: OsmC family protein [Azonexus sp.]|nr:OsmC family protein [Azonexus sp.]
MYRTVVDNTPQVQVTGGKHTASYALDGSQMNPLEAFYATLAGCAAVYAKKACKSLGVPAAGIEIDCKPVAGAGGPLTLGRFQTTVHFPAHFTAEQKTAVLDSIAHCAVKKIVADGPGIDFRVTEA